MLMLVSDVGERGGCDGQKCCYLYSTHSDSNGNEMFTIAYRVPLAQIEVIEGAEDDVFFLLYRVNRSVEGRCGG